jgi:Domain of unknown function (DUF2760)
MNGTLTPIQRFFLAFVAFFYVLMNRRFAEEVKLVRERSRLALPPPEPLVEAPATPSEPAPATAPSPPEPPPAPAPVPQPTPPPALAVSSPAPVREHSEALQVLALLQRDGRLIDFLSESLEGFSDSEIGAAARTVHAGCRKALDAYLDLEPVYGEAEGASVTVAAGFDPSAVRLTGNVVGEPPFKGSLRHHGWRATRTAFPALPQEQDPRILAPAEVEL